MVLGQLFVTNRKQISAAGLLRSSDPATADKCCSILPRETKVTHSSCRSVFLADDTELHFRNLLRNLSKGDVSKHDFPQSRNFAMLNFVKLLVMLGDQQIIFSRSTCKWPNRSTGNRLQQRFGFSSSAYKKQTEQNKQAQKWFSSQSDCLSRGSQLPTIKVFQRNPPWRSRG